MAVIKTIEKDRFIFLPSWNNCSGRCFVVWNSKPLISSSKPSVYFLRTRLTPSLCLHKKEALAEPRPLGVSRCGLGLRTSTPVVEDDQDIGESNASVTINIGGAVVGHWFTVVARSIFDPSATKILTSWFFSRRAPGINAA